MKTKKKLLLMGVGAMSALAIGVGATSTFAWYTANTAVGLSVADTYGALTTTTTTLDLESVTLIIELSPHDWGTSSAKAAEDRTVELTNDSGYIGAYINSGAQTQSTTTGHQIENTIDVKVSVNAANKANLEDTNTIAALKGMTYAIDVAAEGQVRFFSSSTVSSAGVKAAKLRITFDSSAAPTFGDLADSKYEITNLSLKKVMIEDSGWKEVHYAIRTNNTSGAEYVKDGDANGTGVKAKASATASSGNYCYDTDYEVKLHDGTDFKSLSPKVYLHDADKVTIAAGSLARE